VATLAVADEAPAQRGPGGPCTAGVLRRPIKCHVTATKRKTCIANKRSAVDQMGDRLATIDMGRKLGGVPPFFGGGRRSWVPIQHNVAGAEAYLHVKFHLGPSNRLATIHQHYRQTDSGPIAQSKPVYKRSPKIRCFGYIFVADNLCVFNHFYAVRPGRCRFR